MAQVTGASWSIEHLDGSFTHQFDLENPNVHHESGEVPFRAIDWPRVKSVTFESQWVKETFDVTQPPPGYVLSLRSRHSLTSSNEGLTCFLLIVSPDGAELNDETPLTVFYWFPDGSSHVCNLFNCADVREYAHRFVHGLPEQSLSPIHAGVV